MNSPASPTVATAAKRHIGQILISQGILTEDQLRIALLEQMKSKLPVGKLLVNLGFVSEATLRDALSEKLGLQSVDLSQIIIDSQAMKLVPRDFALRHHIFPVALDREHGTLIVALSDTNNLVALDQLRARLRGELELESRLAGDTEISRAIEQYYGHELSIDGILHEIETGEVDYQSLAGAGEQYSQPVVRLIAALLADAVGKNASDIHFEPEQNFLRIRYRIDGVLRQIRSLHKTYWPAMAVRIKVLAKMNIAETRAPQDGRISLSLTGRQVDFRVASQATSHGENVVLRILDRQKGIVPLDGLGLESSQLDLLKRLISRPEGIILVTGPTGSGKTTTLYSILNHINSDALNIMTMEDPVEYRLPRINQVQVNARIDLTFARILRSALRQDPDVIMVGEMRDAETAEIGVRAAMTGHLVLSTLHTNDSISTVNRLVDMGVPGYMVATALNAVIAQRLVRRVCENCAEPYELTPGEQAWLRAMSGGRERDARFRCGTGCQYCNSTGYRGRIGLYELLELDASLADHLRREDYAAFERAASQQPGFRPLVQSGLDFVLQGVTTIAEVIRVTGSLEDLPSHVRESGARAAAQAA